MSFLPSLTQYLKHLLNVLTYFEYNVIHKTKWPMSTLNDSHIQMLDTAQYNPHEAFIQIKVLSIDISETICKVNILRNYIRGWRTFFSSVLCVYFGLLV